MNCPSCDHANRDSARFCEECGGSLAARCAECGSEVRDTAKFCDSCGAALTTAAPEPDRHEVRKVVTVVFVDLAGSTSLQEHMDPESVRRTMDRFYAQMRTEIEAAGGVVVKFTGDGVMAGFGIREASEDDALRAVRAAAAMRESFAAFAAEVAEGRGATVSLRIGINTGEVVVSEADDDVVGDVVNVAARLEHAAGEGNVLVGEETRRLTRHAVTYEAVEPLELKGKTEPVSAYRLVSLEAPPEEATAPFVGRTAELEGLRDVYERSVAAGKPSIITILGSPGLGKTRIATEFAASVSDRARILEATCYATATATYAPVAEALRTAAGIADTASEDEVIASLEALLPEDFSDRARVAQLAGSLLGVGDPAAPQETFWAVRRLLEGLAADRPLVVMVDDVQWAEPMFLDLLDHVVEWAKDAAIVIVALARPEIREVRPSLVDAGSIVLEGLPPEHTAQLAATLLGAHDLPGDLVRRILAATEGNPLFVRELLRMLVDDGVLSRDGDRWTVTIEADEIDVPPTIHALLASRIERLRDEERAVVERASVVGKEFYRGAVLELVPPQVGSGIDAHLETLRRKELVEPEGTYWIDERVFRFHHVLIRDAAYRRLLKEARAELHERFADWLAAKVGDLVGEHDEVLGYHLEQAHTYLRDLGSLGDRSADLGHRASLHLASATRRALNRDDLAAAANLSGRALALTDDEETRALSLLDRCEALLGMGDVRAAEDAVAELRSLVSDDRLRAWADCFDGQLAVLTDPSRLRETAEFVEDAARRLEDLGDKAGAAKAHATHAQALAHLGRFGACEAALDLALAAAREAGDRRRANAVLASAPLAALWGPSPVPRASGRCLDVVRVLRITAGAPAVEATALRCQAVLEAMRGRADAARRMLASARETVEELGLRHALVECDLFGGLIELFADEMSAAEAAFRRAYVGFGALNVDTDTAQAAALLARTLVEQHKDDEALTLTEESERLGGDDLKTAIAWRTVRARVLARRGDLEAAVDLARAAVDLAEPTDALIDHADARSALAEVLSAAGHHEDAEVESRAGLELQGRKEVRDISGGPADVASETSVEEHRIGRSTIEPRGRRRVLAAPGVNVDMSLLERGAAALLDRDHDSVAALQSPEHVFVDHRRGLRSQVAGRAFIDGSRSTFKDLDFDWDTEVLAEWSEGVLLTRSTRLGDDWKISSLVIRVSRDGLWCQAEQFDEDDCAAAFTRLDELAYEHSRARQAIDRYVSVPNERGWTQAVPIAGARDAALVRAGDSLAVVTTAGGEVTEVEPFDTDDELGARRRLHERAPGPSLGAWIITRHVDAHNARDWEAMRLLLGPGFVLDDRRPIGWGRLDIDRFLEHLAEGVRSSRSSSLEVKEWISLTPSKCAFVLRWSGVTEEGADFDYPRVLVFTFGPSGHATEAQFFELDQIDQARGLMAGEVPDLGPAGACEEAGDTELDDPYAAAGTPGEAEVRRLLTRIEDTYSAHDWDGFAACFYDDVTVVDHRPASWANVDGLDDLVRGLRSLVDLVPDASVAATTIERLTERGVVAAMRMSGTDTNGGSVELRFHILAGYREGRFDRFEFFPIEEHASAMAGLDELEPRPEDVRLRLNEALRRRLASPDADDLEAAIAELSQQYAATLPPAEADVYRAHTRAGAAYDSHDWEAFRAAWHEDVVVVDRRPVGWGTVHGVDELISHAVGLVDLISDAKAVFASVEAITERGIVTEHRLTGTDVNGGPVEIPYYNVFLHRHGRFDRWERFAAEERDAAVARLHELTSATASLSNGYTRTYDRWIEAVLRRDWQNVAALQSPTVTLEDRRGGLQHLLSGRDELVRSQREAVRFDYRPGCLEPIAIRGERLALHRVLWTLQDESEIEMLIVGEMDDQNRIAAWVVFDLDDLDAALAELDGRYDATLPPAQLEVRRVGYAVTEAYNDHDWDRLVSHYASDVVVVDHRAAGWGALHGADEFGSLVRSLADLIPDVGLLATSIDALTDHGMASTVSITGTDRNGAFVELAYIIVWRLREGRIDHYEVFPIEEREASVARLHELSSSATTIGRAFDRLISAIDDRDLDAFEALFAPDFQQRQRTYHLELDKDAVLTDAGRVLESPTRVRSGRSLFLGQRHAVVEMVWSAEDDTAVGAFEVVQFVVARCDEAGRFVTADVYGSASDFLAALIRAEEMYLEDEATGDDAVWSRHRLEKLWRTFAAYNAGGGGFESMPADFLSIDHRPGGLGVLRGREGWLGWKRSMTDVALESRFEIRSIRLERNVVLLDMSEVGTSTDGGAFEIAVLVLLPLGAARQELFSPEQRADAERRLRQLAGRSGRPSTMFERACERWYGALNARDIAVVKEMHGPGFRLRDHPYHLDLDRKEALATLESTLAGRGDFRRETTITLGDRHGLVKQTWSLDAGRSVGASEVTSWYALRFDSEGRLLVTEVFPADDLLRALARAEELYLEAEATGDKVEISTRRLAIWRVLIAHNEGDRETWESLFDPEVITVDHRPLGRDDIGSDDFLQHNKTLGDVVAEQRVELRSVAIEGAVLLFGLSVVGTNEEGGRFEIPSWSVIDIRGKQQDLFAPEQRDEAERLFRELVEGAREGGGA